MLHFDRQWAVCVKKDGIFQAQSRRDLPRLAVVSTSYYGNAVHLDVPGMDSLSIPLNGTNDKSKIVKIR